jgi:hypothetical protein
MNWVTLYYLAKSDLDVYKVGSESCTLEIRLVEQKFVLR